MKGAGRQAGGWSALEGGGEGGKESVTREDKGRIPATSSSHSTPTPGPRVRRLLQFTLDV